MAYAFVDYRNKFVSAVRDAIPPVVPERFLVIETVAGESVNVGDKYDANGSPRFITTVLPKRPAKWTAFQFLLRFTEQEREVFRVAALTDGKVADFMQLCGAASEVEANHPMTVAGLAYLVAEGHLTQARADEVLGA
jgi:hypothetical protein